MNLLILCLFLFCFVCQSKEIILHTFLYLVYTLQKMNVDYFWCGHGECSLTSCLSLTDSIKNPLIAWCGITRLAQLRIQNRDCDSVPSCSERTGLVEQLVIHHCWQLTIYYNYPGPPLWVPTQSFSLVQYVTHVWWWDIFWFCLWRYMVFFFTYVRVISFFSLVFCLSYLLKKPREEDSRSASLVSQSPGLITIQQPTHAVNLLLHKGLRHIRNMTGNTYWISLIILNFQSLWCLDIINHPICCLICLHSFPEYQSFPRSVFTVCTMGRDFVGVTFLIALPYLDSL